MTLERDLCRQVARYPISLLESLNLCFFLSIEILKDNQSDVVIRQLAEAGQARSHQLVISGAATLWTYGRCNESTPYSLPVPGATFDMSRQRM